MTFVPQDNCLYRFISGLDDDMVLDVSQTTNHEQYHSLQMEQWSEPKFASSDLLAPSDILSSAQEQHDQ